MTWEVQKIVQTVELDSFFLLFRILDLVCEMDAWACRYNRFLDVGGNYRQFFFQVFSVGECFAPLPDRLGRFTSGQELQVFDFSENLQNDKGYLRHASDS